MDDTQRTELIACMEAGTAARVAGAEHGANPHLEALRARPAPDEVAMVMERISAWWDGWEKADKDLSPARVWDERRLYV